jgi:hypothetical protein
MILAGFSIMPVNFNDEKMYGLKVIIIEICFTSFIIFMLSALAYLGFIFGNFVLFSFITLLPDRK